jgi:hypothetical protein
MGPVPGHALISHLPNSIGDRSQKARKLRLYGSSWSHVLNAPIQSGHLISMNIPGRKGESYYANSLRSRGILHIRVIGKVTQTGAENGEF